MNRFTLLIGFLMMSASCGNDTNVSAIDSGSSEQALGDAWGNKTPSGQEVRSDDKLSSNTKGKQRRNTLFVNNGEVVQLEHKRLTAAEVSETTEESEVIEETATETETVPSGSGGGGTSEETPVFDCAGMQGCVCHEDGACNDGLICNAGGVCEPEACDPVGCALMNNACYIFYCSGTNPWCFSAYRDDDWDGAASCPGEVVNSEYGSTFYPGAYDCNDYNAAVRPGNSEVCSDALDNDCDGQMDDEDSECAIPPTEEEEEPIEEGPGGEDTPSVTPGWYECEVSPDTPRANIILGSATTNVLTVRCKAHGEDVRLDTFNVDILGNFAAVVQVNLSVEDGTSWTAAHMDGTVQFGYVEHILPKEVWTRFYVAVELVPLWPTYPISSGDTVQLALGPNKGIGQESADVLNFIPTDPAPMGNEMVIRKTKPTISLASGSPSGAGIPGMSEVLRTYVCADSHGDVYLEQIVFELESTDIGSTTWNDCDARQLGSAVKWDLYDVDDPANKLDADTAWTFLEGDGTICEYGDNLKYAYLQLYDLYVPAGDCRTLVLRLDSSGANSANDNTLRVDIPDQTATAGLATPIDAINWCDDDLACGINGEFIRNLPLVGGTIQF